MEFLERQCCATKNEETLQSLVAGSLLTRLREGLPRCIGGCGARVPSCDQQTDKASANTWFEPVNCNLCNAYLRRFGNRQRGLGKRVASRYISGMAKRKRETEWEVIRLKATPAAFVGSVQAPDKATALRTAIKQFNIRTRGSISAVDKAEVTGRGRRDLT